MPKLLSLFILFLSLVILRTAESVAESTESYIPTAPTSFQTNIEPGPESEIEKALRSPASLQVRNNGGFGSFSTFSIRGSESKDIGVSLEGIRLNSPAQGAFDLSNISLFGVKDLQVVRGGYAPFSSNPSGYVNLRLPQEDRLQTKIAWGSYNYYSLGQLTPNASFSFERSKNDFLYSSGGSFLRRTSNESLRMNLRSWHRAENYQVWGMLNLIDRELPPPANNLSARYETHFQSIAPMLAFQGSKNSWIWSTWAKFEEQATEKDTDTSHNRLWYSGAQLEKIQAVLPDLSLRHGIEFTQDYLFHADFDAKNRHSVSLASSAYWTPVPGQLIHPRVRVEFVTDLQQPISAHPGIGGRHEIFSNFSALWNLAYISRAPNFGELYYDVAGSESNPDLDREQSLQADLGYEWKLPPLKLEWKQAVFAARSFDVITNIITPDDNFKNVNAGTQVNLGVENELQVQPFEVLFLNASYTYLHAMLEERQKAYVARHQFTTTPSLAPHESLRFSLPVYARSSVWTSKNLDEKLDRQWDVGARLQGSWDRWIVALEVFNLLAWQLEEIRNYPLPQETYFRLSAEARF